MAAVYVSNLVINCGSDFGQTFTLEETLSNSSLNLTGYTAAAQMRKHAGSSTATNFATSIVLPATEGKLILSLTASQTENLKPGRYVYDIVLTKDGAKTKVVEGMVLVREGVTR